MKFCIECGSELEEGLKFCTSCGANQDQEDESASIQSSVEDSSQEEKQPVVNNVQETKRFQEREPLPRKKKILYSALAAIVVAIIGIHLVVSNLLDAEKAAVKIHNAIMADDSAGLFKELTIKKDVQYGEDIFMQFIKDNTYEEVFLNELKLASKSAQDEGVIKSIYDDNGVELFKVKPKKAFLFYTLVDFVPTNYEFTIVTDLDNAKLSINDQEYDFKAEDIKVGKFLPGVYLAKLSTDADYTASEREFELAISDDRELYVEEDDYVITLAGDELDSIVFINGESTEKTIEDLGKIGPIFEDMQLTLHVEKETPEGEMAKSYDYNGYQGADIYFEYPYGISFIPKTPEEIAAEKFDTYDLEYFLQIYFSDYMRALNDADFSLVEDYYVKDSEPYKEIKDTIGSIKDDDVYSYSLNNITVDDFNLSPDEAKLTVDDSFYFRDDQDNETLFERDVEYTVILSDDEFQIKKIKIKDTKKTRQ